MSKQIKAQSTQKPTPPAKKIGVQPGRWGVCDVQLWEFTELLEEDASIPIERVAASSLEDALKFMRRRYPDCIIVKAAALGIIAMLSGSPFE